MCFTVYRFKIVRTTRYFDLASNYHKANCIHDGIVFHHNLFVYFYLWFEQMMLYLSFPVAMFWISNQAEYFEEYVVKRKVSSVFFLTVYISVASYPIIYSRSVNLLRFCVLLVTNVSFPVLFNLFWYPEGDLPPRRQTESKFNTQSSKCLLSVLPIKIITSCMEVTTHKKTHYYKLYVNSTFSATSILHSTFFAKVVQGYFFIYFQRKELEDFKERMRVLKEQRILKQISAESENWETFAENL